MTEVLNILGRNKTSISKHDKDCIYGIYTYISCIQHHIKCEKKKVFPLQFGTSQE